MYNASTGLWNNTHTLSGYYSHAQGESTIAIGTASFVGGIGTIASGSYQTVFGQYNLTKQYQ